MNATKALKLPTTYRPTATVIGHVRFSHLKLQALHSGTAGHVVVYAIQDNFGAWQKITKDQFKAYSGAVISGATR
jgi:hypothetical protein